MCDIMLNDQGKVVKNDKHPRIFWKKFSGGLALQIPDHTQIFAMLTFLRGYLQPYLPASDLGYVVELLNETSVKEHFKYTGLRTYEFLCCV